MIDATIPNGGELGSDLATLLLEARGQINLLWTALGTTGVTPRLDVALAADHFDVGGIQFQTVFVSAGAPTDLVHITGGYDGQIVLMKGVNSNVTLKYNVAKMDLNSSVDYNLLINDWIMLMNYGGNGSTIDGIWKEVSRTTWV